MKKQETHMRTIMLGAALTALIAGTAAAQTPIGDLSPRGGVTIRGEITDVFGNKFVVQDGSGRTLVESGPAWRQRLPLEAGETVTVTGRPGASGFDAFTIVRENGERIEIRGADAPPPRMGGPATATTSAARPTPRPPAPPV
jgi:hypothetical protein